MIRAVAALALLLAVGALQPAVDLERLPFAPRKAICYRASGPLSIDGRLDESSWRAAAWSEPFVDIEGDARPAPRLATRTKMLWDDDYLYVGADLEETDVWGTLTTRDSVIYQENDFEIFIDPDGDTHEYYELEINALNTVWDLMLVRPYRDGGPAIDAWDIAGLKTAVHVRGTLNRPGDKDDGWSVEIAMPWKVLAEAAPGARPPEAGEQWRMNFSRVQWQLDVRDGKYVKRTDEKGRRFPRTTGCGARKAPSRCTCRSDGAMCSSPRRSSPSGLKPSSKALTNRSSGRFGVSTTARRTIGTRMAAMPGRSRHSGRRTCR